MSLERHSAEICGELFLRPPGRGGREPSPRTSRPRHPGRAAAVVADDTVALLRAEAGRRPYNPQLSDPDGRLSTRSDELRVRWAAHDVRIHNTGAKRRHHPVVGDLDLPYASLPVEAGSRTAVVTYLPEPGSPSYDALAVLASWHADEVAQSRR